MPLQIVFLCSHTKAPHPAARSLLLSFVVFSMFHRAFSSPASLRTLYQDLDSMLPAARLMMPF